MKTVWIGEIEGPDGEVVSIDFPQRETKEEALSDAVASCTTGRPIAAEWSVIDDGELQNTGNVFDGHRSDAYNTGYEAAVRGVAQCDNPYPSGTWERGEWNCGWMDAF